MIKQVLFGLLLTSAAAAATTQRQEFCSAWEDIARSAMTARQAGVPLTTMLQLVSDETAQGILRAAYQLPVEVVGAEQQNAIAGFVTKVVIECLES